MNPSTSVDPFLILGISRDAGEKAVRARYLELVKQFPPDREPEKFREIRTAFEITKDPLAIAGWLVGPLGEDVPEWSRVIELQQQNPPRLSPTFLLSLGNRAMDNSVGDDQNHSDLEPRPGNDPASPQVTDTP